MTDLSEATEVDQATQLPNPTGYRMLCALPEVEDKFTNGILKPDALAKIEEFSTVVLFVSNKDLIATRTQQSFLRDLGARKVILCWFALILEHGSRSITASLG